MGFRFRKSVKVGGVRLNFSKSGTSVSIPGTGISYKPSKKKNKKKSNYRNQNVVMNPEDGWKLLAWTCRIFWLPMVILGCLLGIVEPTIGGICIVTGVFEKIWSKKYFKEREKMLKCCSECGAVNDTTYNFCIKCGTKLA